MLAEDHMGNRLVSFIDVDEETAAGLYQPVTVCLVVVKIENDFLFGFNHWRKCWEIFGGCPEAGETMRQTIERESKEELGIENMAFEWLGLARFYLMPDYFSSEEREEFGGIFGITLSKEDFQKIEQSRTDKEEIERISLLQNIPKTDTVRTLDKKLTEYYPRAVN